VARWSGSRKSEVRDGVLRKPEQARRAVTAQPWSAVRAAKDAAGLQDGASAAKVAKHYGNLDVSADARAQDVAAEFAPSRRERLVTLPVYMLTRNADGL
jgi:hypothetical protein